MNLDLNHRLLVGALLCARLKLIVYNHSTEMRLLLLTGKLNGTLINCVTP